MAVKNLVDLAEAAVVALESYKEQREGLGEGTDGLKALIRNLKHEIREEKTPIIVGNHKVSEGELYALIVNKLSKEQFAEIVKQVEKDLDEKSEE